MLPAIAGGKAAMTDLFHREESIAWTALLHRNKTMAGLAMPWHHKLPSRRTCPFFSVPPTDRNAGPIDPDRRID
jgi:hypothetical protein